MKRFVVAALALVILALPAYASQWEMDTPHSNLTFKVSHLVISTVTGEFGSFTGKFDFEPDHLENGSAEMTIDVTSISTANDKRDAHLKSADFFDVEKFPTMTFKSTKVVPGEGKNFKIVGDLTIKGITRPVTFDCVYKGSVDFMGTTKTAFTCTTTINREDFNIMWNKALETGGYLVGKDVEITLGLELNKIS